MPIAVTDVYDCNEGRMEAFWGASMFDVCTDAGEPNTVFLYELYDDLAAFEAHQTMPHYIATGPKVADLVANKTLRTFERVDR